MLDLEEPLVTSPPTSGVVIAISSQSSQVNYLFCTGSKATQEGYRFEIREFTGWRDRHHPHLHLREMNPAFCQDWVDELRREVEAERIKPRTFNRRIAAISSLYRWAAEPYMYALLYSCCCILRTA